MAMQGDEASIERGYRRLSSLFLRPGIDQQKCQRCKMTVYQQERLGPVHDVVFHKTCFKCVTCGQFLTLKNYWSNQVDPEDREIYCNSHVPRIGGARIDKEALGIKSAMSVQQHFKRNADSKTSEKRIPDNIPQVGADALMIQRALRAPKTNQYGQEGNVPASSLAIDAWGIKDAMDAQVLQKRYQRKLDKHHFPPHIAKRREQLFNAQKELEAKMRKEEDEMFRGFQSVRKQESEKISEEINKEWEVRLKELTAKFDKQMEGKRKKMKDNERKLMTIQFENEKNVLQKTMSMKREKKKKTMTLRLREKEQSTTSDLVKRQSVQMLSLLAAKQEEMKKELAVELQKELAVELQNDLQTEQSAGQVSEPPVEEIMEVLQTPTVFEPPSPKPPRCRKRNLYSDVSVFSDIDEQVIEVAEGEQLTYTDLVKELTENLVSDLEKARAIYRWITVKDLNVMEFDETIAEDTPMGLLRGIKFGTETYHVLFMRLCSYCGLHCVEIKGHSKSVGYEPGMEITPDTFQNTWNAVLIDGDWRLIQCNWGARHLVLNKDKEKDKDKPKKRDQIRYQYDEHYFLTDPDEFIQEFWPYEQKWQLLVTPITLPEFEALPFVRSVFFHYGMRFDQSRLAVLETDDKGGVKISIKIPEELENDLVFFYQLRFADKERKHELTYRGASLERFVFQTMVDNTVTFSVHVPTVADYFFEIFANKIDETNRCVEENNANFAPFRLKCACKFKILCTTMSGKMHPLPNCAAGEWGPKKALRHFGLAAVPFEGGESSDNVETSKAGILTVEEKFSVKFNIPRPLQFVAKLRMNQVEDQILDPFVHLSADAKILTITITLPQTGQYGIDLYARPKGVSDCNTLSHACKYLINCTKVDTPLEIPKTSSSSKNKWGPTSSFDEFGLKLVSHKDPKIRISDSNLCHIELEVPQNINLSFQFLREPDEDNRDYVQMVRLDDRPTIMRFNITLTRSGNYMLSLYARRDKSDDRSLPNVYNYLIQHSRSPMESNGGIHVTREKSSSIFRKGLFSKKEKHSDKNSDRFSDKSSDKSSDSR
ncbi:hillarin-like [Haliotis asinina]|uniref:hillarin-like n=1 Tax=Haliotis asinina TaxID=109174 RepID=UPI0035320757